MALAGALAGSESEIVSLYQGGVSTYKLSCIFGVSRTAIKLLLRRQGIEIKRPTRKQTNDPPEVVVEQVVRLRLERMRHRDIARRVGIPDARVTEILVSNGLHTRLKRGEDATARSKVKSAQIAELVARYLGGETIDSLAKSHGCTFRPIKDALVKAGVELRKRGGSNRALAYRPGFTDKVLALWDAKMSQSAIARDLGCSQGAISDLLRARGILDSSKASGKRHGGWKGGRTITQFGYVQVCMAHDHPFAKQLRTANGYVLEHRLVMAEHLGRPLATHESVHHIDGVRTNNVIDNLQLRTGSHGAHVRYRCLDCGSDRIEPAEL